MDDRTGKAIAPITLISSAVITILDCIVNRCGTPPYQSTVGCAVRWMMENLVRTFDWKAQFDDAKLRGPYQNLSKHGACEFAGYLFAHAGGDAARLATAEELLRFAEDQFVVREQPPPIKARADNLKPELWFTPCSLEQYAMFEPISGSSAFMRRIITAVTLRG